MVLDLCSHEALCTHMRFLFSDLLHSIYVPLRIVRSPRTPLHGTHEHCPINVTCGVRMWFLHVTTHPP